jgi:hypothetical protein
MKSHVLPRNLNYNLILGFFWKFSLFECALKRKGYLKSFYRWEDDKEPGAIVDWGKFEEDIKGRFGTVSVPDFKEAVDKLRQLSPGRQVVTKHGTLGFKKFSRRRSQSDEAYILELLKTARNNLFHGGKAPNAERIDEIAENNNILQAGITIIQGYSEMLAVIHDEEMSTQPVPIAAVKAKPGTTKPSPSLH